MSKSLFTNIISFVVFSFGLAFGNSYLLQAGLFAFSGAITNYLAIYMIFEKVPFLYGSGVIENKFDDFKNSIKNLMMEQFFTKDNLEKFLSKELKTNNIDFDKLVEKIDFNIVFNSLKEAVLASPLGGMLNMFGGEKVVDSLKDTFIKHLKLSFLKIVQSDSFKATFEEIVTNKNTLKDLNSKIETIIEARLDELTPKMVKNMIEKIIKEHLGWLVIWGGVFGGVIGIVIEIVKRTL